MPIKRIEGQQTFQPKRVVYDDIDFSDIEPIEEEPLRIEGPTFLRAEPGKPDTLMQRLTRVLPDFIREPIEQGTSTIKQALFGKREDQRFLEERVRKGDTPGLREHMSSYGLVGTILSPLPGLEPIIGRTDEQRVAKSIESLTKRGVDPQRAEELAIAEVFSTKENFAQTSPYQRIFRPEREERLKELGITEEERKAIRNRRLGQMGGSVFELLTLPIASLKAARPALTQAIKVAKKSEDVVDLLVSSGVPRNIATQEAGVLARTGNERVINKAINRIEETIKMRAGRAEELRRLGDPDAEALAKPLVERGRLRELDSRVIDIDRQIDDLGRQIVRRKKDGRGFADLERRRESLLNRRNRFEIQRAEIVSPDTIPSIRGRVAFTEREAVRAISKGVREGSISTRKQISNAQDDLARIIQDAGLLPAERQALEAQVRNLSKATDPRARLERIIPNIEARIVKAKASREVSKLTSNINKTLRQYSPKKEFGVLRGKLTSEGQENIDMITRALNEFEVKKIDGKNVIDVTRAQNKINENLRLISEGVDPMTEARLLTENEALSAAGSLRSKKIADGVGTEKLNRVQQRIQEIIDDPSIGRTAREREAFNISEEINRKRTYLRDSTLNGAKLDTNIDATPMRESAFAKAKGKVIEFMDKHLSNADFWAAKADSFNPNSVPLNTGVEHVGWFRETRKLVNADAKYIAKTQDDIGRMGDLIMNNYNVKSGRDALRLEKEMNDLVNIGKFKFRDGQTKTLKMTRGQLMAKYAQMQQEVGVIRLKQGNQWTDEILDAVVKKMRPQDKRMVQSVIDDWYPSIRNEVNPLHEARTGISIGLETNYSPMPTRFGGDLPDQIRLASQEYARKSTTPKGVKARVDLTDISPDVDVSALAFDDFFFTAYKHSMEMRRYEAFTEPIYEMRRLLAHDSEARQALVQQFGRAFPQQMDLLLDQMAKGGLDNINNLDKIWKWRTNFTKAVFGLQPNRLFKEATSSILWALEESPSVLANSAKELFAKGMYKKTANEIWENSPFIRARGTRATYDRDISVNAENRTPLKLFTERQDVIDKSLAFQRAGDKIGIYSFGVPYYHAQKTRLMKSGVPEKEAIEQAISLFEQALRRNQVSGRTVDLGQFQRTGELGPFLTQFKTATIALLRQEVNAIRGLGLKHRLGFQNATPPKESIARNLVKLSAIRAQFALFQFVADGFRFDPERQRRAFFLGPWGSPIILGNGLEATARIISGDDVFGRGSIDIPGLDVVGNAFYTAGQTGKELIRDGLIDGKMSYDEYLEAMLDIAESVGHIYGIPAGNFRHLVTRGAQFARGDLTNPRDLIFSNYALDISRNELPGLLGGQGADSNFLTGDGDGFDFDFDFDFDVDDFDFDFDFDFDL